MDNVYDLKMQLNCQNESQIYTRNFCIKMKIKYMNGWAGGIWSWIILSMVFPRQSLSHLTTSFLSLPSPCCTNYSRSPSSIPFHLPSQISCSLIDDNKWCKCAFHWQASPSRYILHVCPLLIHCNINTTTITQCVIHIPIQRHFTMCTYSTDRPFHQETSTDRICFHSNLGILM